MTNKADFTFADLEIKAVAYAELMKMISPREREHLLLHD